MSTEYTHFSRLSFDSLFARGPDGSEQLVIDANGTFYITAGAFTNSSNQIILGTPNTLTINANAPAAPRIATIPSLTADDSFVFLAQTQTLTNKTLTSPVISTISNTGTLTLPTSTDTLVGKATTDILTNKTINAASNTISNISDTEIKVGAAITRTKLATGSASHVLINDGSGIISSEARLALSRFTTGTSGLPLVGAGASDSSYAQISLTAAVSGILPVANGGTNSNASLSNNRVMKSSGGTIIEAAAITANKALISDANGIPTQSTVTNTELAFVSGVTSAIQTQLNSITAVGANLDAGYVANLSVSTSVSSNAMTVSFVDRSGSALSSSNTASINFRSTTLTSGNDSTVTIAAAGPTVVIPTNATLGSQNAIADKLYVYAINNAGTVEVAVSGSLYSDVDGIVSTTAISSSATSATVLYSTTARTNVAARLIAVCDYTETTAGTWASNVTSITSARNALIPTANRILNSAWIPYTPTLSGFGTASSISFFYRRSGPNVQIRGSYTCGTTAATTAQVTFPAGITPDTTYITGTFPVLGYGISPQSGSLFNLYYGDSTHANFLNNSSQTNGSQIATSSTSISLVMEFPVTQFAM
jgi:hypothetical protein